MISPTDKDLERNPDEWADDVSADIEGSIGPVKLSVVPPPLPTPTPRCLVLKGSDKEGRGGRGENVA